MRSSSAANIGVKTAARMGGRDDEEGDGEEGEEEEEDEESSAAIWASAASRSAGVGCWSMSGVSG